MPLLLSLLIWGCSGYRHYAIQSNQADPGKYHSFARLPVPITSHHVNDIVDEKIKDAATAGLEKRGFVAGGSVGPLHGPGQRPRPDV